MPARSACRMALPRAGLARHQAPSGVLMRWACALVLRDIVQRRLGALAGFAAIAAGHADLGLARRPPSIVIASATAFLLSELADFAVYTPLQRRRFLTAVFASGIAGLVRRLDRLPAACLRQPRLPRTARSSARPGWC